MTLKEISFQGSKNSRTLNVHSKSKVLATPTYFPSISSYGTKYSLTYLVELLCSYSYPRILISAYDLHHIQEKERKHINSILAKYISKSFVFLDSGIFESKGFKDSEWEFKKYEEIIQTTRFDFFTSFDLFPAIKKSSDGFIDSTFHNIQQSSDVSSVRGFIPVVHGLHQKQLLSIIGVLLKRNPTLFEFLAISEEDCGATLSERIRTISAIRGLLDTYSPNSLLHILGCGNPLSIALFSLYGADSFDSLDWTRFVLNPDKLCFEDYSYLELIDCNCPFCRDTDNPYLERYILHNLHIYQKYMKTIRAKIQNNELENFISESFGYNSFEF